jgi:hypothetical protein
MPWPFVPKDWSTVVLPFFVTASVLQQELHDKFVVLGVHSHGGGSGEGSADLVPHSVTMAAGSLQQAKGADLATITANAIALGTDGDYFNVTAASTTINTVGARQAGARVLLRFTNAQTVHHDGGTIILQTGVDWAAAAGSVLELVSEGAGVWREVNRWVGPALSALTLSSLTMTGPIFGKQGADVASANACLLPTPMDGNFFNLTGVTTVQTITIQQPGTVIVFLIPSGLTLTHLFGTTGQMKLAGSIDWVAPAGSVLTLVSDGSAWHESARTLP